MERISWGDRTFSLFLSPSSFCLSPICFQEVTDIPHDLESDDGAFANLCSFSSSNRHAALSERFGPESLCATILHLCSLLVCGMLGIASMATAGLCVYACECVCVVVNIDFTNSPSLCLSVTGVQGTHTFSGTQRSPATGGVCLPSGFQKWRSFFWFWVFHSLSQCVYLQHNRGEKNPSVFWQALCCVLLHLSSL